MLYFAKDYARSWMGNADHVAELDKLVTGRLVSTLRSHSRVTQPPVGFKNLVRQLQRHVESELIFEVVCDCALLGELIFTSGRGGIYKLSETDDPDEKSVHTPLLALRNACFHPGNLGDAPSIPALIEALRLTGELGLSARLTKDWGLLSLSADMGRWSLQRIHAVGRLELIALGRWPNA